MKDVKMMWWKDDDEDQDQYAALKIALKIAARRLLAEQYPEAEAAMKILTKLCVGINDAEGDTYDDVVVAILDEYTDVFEDDPMLKADISDILTLMGLGDMNVEVEKVDALITVVCDLVS